MITSRIIQVLEKRERLKMADYKKLKDEFDTQGMYDKIASFPVQMQAGFEIGQKADLPKIDIAKVKNIIVCGLGGSAIGGDLVRTFLADTIKIPFQVCRHYTLPEFAGEDTLCILSSYSGNTEETLSAYADAKKHGA